MSGEEQITTIREILVFLFTNNKEKNTRNSLTAASMRKKTQNIRTAHLNNWMDEMSKDIQWVKNIFNNFWTNFKHSL